MLNKYFSVIFLPVGRRGSKQICLFVCLLCGKGVCHVTELGQRLPDVGMDSCKLTFVRRRPNVVTNGWYTLVGQPVANEQKDVGPTLTANFGQPNYV